MAVILRGLATSSEGDAYVCNLQLHRED